MVKSETKEKHQNWLNQINFANFVNLSKIIWLAVLKNFKLYNIGLTDALKYEIDHFGQTSHIPQYYINLKIFIQYYFVECLVFIKFISRFEVLIPPLSCSSYTFSVVYSWVIWKTFTLSIIYIIHWIKIQIDHVGQMMC